MSVNTTEMNSTANIKTALILAAGRGTRLEEMTDYIPKCLVEVHGQSLMERMLSQLNSNGFENAIIVVGYQAEKIIQKFGYQYKNLRIEYVKNDFWETTNNVLSLYLAVSYLKEDFILLESDLILETQALQSLRHTNMMAVEAFQSFMDGTVVALNEDKKVTTMYLKSSKQRPRQLDAYFKTVNMYSFSVKNFQENIVPILKEVLDEGKTDVYYELAFERAIEQGLISFRAVDFSTFKWAEIDNQEDWKRASALFEETILQE